MDTLKVTGSGTLIVDGANVGEIEFELFRRTISATSEAWSGHGTCDPGNILKAMRGQFTLIETASASFSIEIYGYDLSDKILLFDVRPLSTSI